MSDTEALDPTGTFDSRDHLSLIAESTSLDRLYFLLREAHAEVEQTQYQLACRKADLEAARKELDKAIYLAEGKTEKARDIELAIVDRRRAERGINLSATPPESTADVRSFG